MILVAMVSHAERTLSDADWLSFHKLSCMSLILDGCKAKKWISLEISGDVVLDFDWSSSESHDFVSP